jgi:ABC-type iron transport system FetAB ATPase subunit
MSDPAPKPALSIDGLRSSLAGPFALTLASGQCAAVTGPSGSGKSLFLRMIADLDVNEGAVALDGAPRETFAPPLWRRRVCYVAAEAGWWSDRVRDHFNQKDLSRAAERAADLGLAADLIDGEVARLSTGERQRLALIRALLLQPRVLLLDEPTGALDQVSARKVEAVVRGVLATGAATIVVTHDESLAERLGGGAHYRMADRRLGPA